MTAATATDSPTPARLPAPVIGAAAIIAALSLFGMATENHYGQCVAAAAASAPAATASSGARGVPPADDTQRQATVGGCKRYLFI